MRQNKMKAKIRAGQAAFGCALGFPAPEIVEMLGLLGFDWVLIDCEHGSMNEESAEAMIVSATLHDITPIVRVPVNRPEVILRYMDRGAMGVQVPHVNTKEQATAAVQAVKYYPLGSRGMGAGRPAEWGITGSRGEYLDWANRETLVCVQIEEAEAVKNLGEILTVPEVDVFFVGPADLSQSLGYPGQQSHPVVQETVDRCLAQIKAAGKVSGGGGVTYWLVWARGCNTSTSIFLPSLSKEVVRS